VFHFFLSPSVPPHLLPLRTLVSPSFLCRRMSLLSQACFHFIEALFLMILTIIFLKSEGDFLFWFLYTMKKPPSFFIRHKKKSPPPSPVSLACVWHSLVSIDRTDEKSNVSLMFFPRPPFFIEYISPFPEIIYTPHKSGSRLQNRRAPTPNKFI